MLTPHTHTENESKKENVHFADKIQQGQDEKGLITFLI